MGNRKNMSDRIVDREKTYTGKMDTLFLRNIMNISRQRECEIGDAVFELLDAAQMMLDLTGHLDLREVVASSTKIPENINEAIVVGGMIDANIKKIQKGVIMSTISPSRLPDFQPSKN